MNRYKLIHPFNTPIIIENPTLKPIYAVSENGDYIIVFSYKRAVGPIFEKGKATKEMLECLSNAADEGDPIITPAYLLVDAGIWRAALIIAEDEVIRNIPNVQLIEGSYEFE